MLALHALVQHDPFHFGLLAQLFGHPARFSGLEQAAEIEHLRGAAGGAQAGPAQPGSSQHLAHAVGVGLRLCLRLHLRAV